MEDNESWTHINKLKPLTIITGFLGSGKTTLLHYILHNKSHGKRIAVLENEFAKDGIGVKNELENANAESSKQDSFAIVMETSNGCLCCEAKGDFLSAIKTLLGRKDEFDHILVETTGLADPSFAFALFQDPEIKDSILLTGIVTLVDTKFIEARLDARVVPGSINEAQEQITFADKIVLNKLDLVSNSDVDRIEKRVRELNPAAHIIRTERSVVDLSVLLSENMENLRILQTEERPTRHDSAINYVQLNVTSKHAIPKQDFENWIHNLPNAAGGELFRMKGIVCIKQDEICCKMILQGVRDQFELKNSINGWAQEEPMTRLIFIGRMISNYGICKSFESTFDITPDSLIPPQVVERRAQFSDFLVHLPVVYALMILLTFILPNEKMERLATKISPMDTILFPEFLFTTSGVFFRGLLIFIILSTWFVHVARQTVLNQRGFSHGKGCPCCG